MSDGTNHKDGPASLPNQGKGTFSLESGFGLSPSIRPLRRKLLQGMVGVALFSAPLLAHSTAATPSVKQFLAKNPWLLPWIDRGEFDPEWLTTLLADIKPDRRVIKWMDHQAESKPYRRYRNLFISTQRIKGGRKRLKEYAATLASIKDRYGVPEQVVVALWGIESNFGGNTGSYGVLRTLYTLSTGYPRRAGFFRGQLRHFLLLCREEGFSPRTLRGSYAGAMGQVQMIPETMRRYAVDFDGDGKRDVFGSPPDVLASIASFLHGHGWQAGEPYVLAPVQRSGLAALVSPSLADMKPWRWWRDKNVRLPPETAAPTLDTMLGLIKLKEQDGPRYYLVFNNFRVVTRWNRSTRFAMVVHELANQIRIVD
jgi:membrane-bound lytic murein transglycosylase B